MRWENIKFVSFNDFYKHKKIIRYYYKELSLEQKWAYKRFIYSDELNEKEVDKDCIWNFLNENENCRKEIIERAKNKRYTKKNRQRKEKPLINFLEPEDESLLEF